MTPKVTCRQCRYPLDGHAINGACPECGFPICDSCGGPGVSRRASIVMLIAALAYPALVTIVFFASDPWQLAGLGYPLTFVAIVPAAIFGVAFALRCAGVRFHWMAVTLLLILVSVAAAAAWWGWQATQWRLVM